MGTWRLAVDIDWNGLPRSSLGGGQGVRASVEGEPLHPPLAIIPMAEITTDSAQRSIGERDFCTCYLAPVSLLHLYYLINFSSEVLVKLTFSPRSRLPSPFTFLSLSVCA